MPNTSWPFTINNLFLPANATGLFMVSVEVNPSVIAGRIMTEIDYTNNFRVFPELIRMVMDQSISGKRH